MNQPRPKDGIDRLASRALIILFVALLWLPTLDSLWNLDRCPPPK